MEGIVGRVTSVLLCASLAACASRPDRIQASVVPYASYMASDCAQLGVSMADARRQLEKLWSMQDAKANLDATSVLIAFIPASAFTGDHAADVARYKGQVVAIATAQASKGCAAAVAA